MKLKQLDAFSWSPSIAPFAARARSASRNRRSAASCASRTGAGVPLVVRSVKGIELTDYGSAFAIRARLIVEEIQRTRDEIEQLRLGTTGSVSIAVSPTVALTLLPRAFAAFSRDLPGATLNVDDALTATDLARLRDGSLDFIVTHQLSNAIPDPDEFASIPLFRTAFAVVARSRHRLARARCCAVSSMLNGACRATATEATIWCARSSPFGIDVPKRVVHCPSFAATLSRVANGCARRVRAAARRRRTQVTRHRRAGSHRADARVDGRDRDAAACVADAGRAAFHRVPEGAAATVQGTDGA